MKYNNTKIVNAFAGPGAGKTTACLEIVSQLKMRGKSAEYVPEYAKELISDFVEEEYGNEKVDFSDLSSIDVAYTTTDDELYDVQTKINLENFSINYFLDGNIIKTKGYGSLQELCVLALSCLSFDWLIEPAIDYWYDECVKGDM